MSEADNSEGASARLAGGDRANGDSDPMILPHYSYLLAGLMPQHHAEFATDVEAFLSDPREP